jgi:hypothetical protein
MNATSYILKPVTTEDFISNVEFQLLNVKGWQMAFRDGAQPDNEPARIKAQCLSDAARDLLHHLETTKAKR